MQYDNEVQLFFPAKSENESFARLFTAAFFMPLDPSISELADIKTAVSEAVTNAIIHGYEKKEGTVGLFCAHLGNKIFIRVSDKGSGIENITQAREPLFTSKPEMERSGMGFTIMETFMDHISVESKLGEGTEILMEKILIKE